jgi:hypothetical protein
MSFLQTMFTGADNASGDLGRVLWALGVVSFLFLSGWGVIVNHAPLDVLAWPAGLGLALTGGASALALKKGTEPPAGPPG